MDKTKRIFILGNFGYVTNHLDGQTMESRSLLQLLNMNGVNNVSYFDTERLHHERWSFLEIFSFLRKCDIVFYLGAQGSLKYIFPVLWVFSKVMRKEIQYFVVGGWIAEFIKKLPFHRWLLRRIEKMYCETKSIAKKLTDWYGFDHAVWFPNFRIYDFKPTIAKNDSGVFKMVFMSRIVKHKGFHRVFDLAQQLAEKYDSATFEIDFYGPLYDNEKDEFFEGVEKYDFVEYKGVLQPDDINEVLSDYDLMLFPTSYPGEGLPGTILDSYISGIPIIASDWRYNGELIEHGKSGFLYNLEKPNELLEYTVKLFEDRELLYQMKMGAYNKSLEFNHESVWEIIDRNIN